MGMWVRIPLWVLKYNIMKIKLLQKFADFIVIRIKRAKTMDDVKFWFHLGININHWLVNKNIYLN